MRSLTKTPEWLLQNALTIGGSSAAIALGIGRWETRSQLANRIRDAHNGVAPVPLEASDDMRRGLLYEPLALELLSEAVGVSILPADQETFCYHPQYPFAHALVDGWAATAIAEVKVPRPATFARIEQAGALPNYWVVQALHNLIITGQEVCYFGLLDVILARVVVYTVQRDQVFMDRIIEGERDFYDAVLAGVEIEDEPVVTEDWLPAEVSGTPEAIVDDEAMRASVRAWLQFRDVKDDCEDSIEQFRTVLTKRFGEAERIRVPNVNYRAADGRFFRDAVFYFKRQDGRRTLDPDVVRAKYPAVYADKACWQTGKPSRPLRVYARGKLERSLVYDLD